MANGSAAIALRRVLSRPVCVRALAVAAVVGTVLNLINQGDALLTGAPLVWWKVALTYCVPYVVASYGAFCALRLHP